MMHFTKINLAFGNEELNPYRHPEEYNLTSNYVMRRS